MCLLHLMSWPNQSFLIISVSTILSPNPAFSCVLQLPTWRMRQTSTTSIFLFFMNAMTIYFNTSSFDVFAMSLDNSNPSANIIRVVQLHPRSSVFILHRFLLSICWPVFDPFKLWPESQKASLTNTVKTLKGDSPDRLKKKRKHGKRSIKKLEGRGHHSHLHENCKRFITNCIDWKKSTVKEVSLEKGKKVIESWFVFCCWTLFSLSRCLSIFFRTSGLWKSSLERIHPALEYIQRKKLKKIHGKSFVRCIRLKTLVCRSLVQLEERPVIHLCYTLLC